MLKVAFPLTLTVALTLASTAFVPSALADTVTLKSGEEYEGTVLRETDEEVVILVKISNGITDEQTFKKEDVRAVVTTPVDKIEYEKLARYAVGAHSQTPAAYNLAIAAYENFQKRFPESAHQQQVNNQIKAIKDERARVARKEIKINNRWYTPEEIKQEQYQINGQRLLQQMNDQASRGDLVGALNSFDRLETEFKGSSAYPEAVKSAEKLILRLKAEIARAVPLAKQQQQKFDEGIQHTQEPEKTRMLNAHRSNVARAEAAFSQSTAKWKPFFPSLDQSVTALNTAVESESTRLIALDLTPMTQSLKLTDEAREALTAGNFDLADQKLDEAETAWKENEAVARLKTSIATLRQRQAAEQAEAAAAEAEAAKEAKEKSEKSAPASAEAESKKG